MSIMKSCQLAFVAAVALAGCAGGADPSIEPESEAAAVARAEAAGKQKSVVATEIAAPESTKIETPIASEERSRLSAEASGAKSDATIVSCVYCHLFEPDLTVVEDDRPQTICNAYGCYPAYAKGFVVKNVGNWSAPTFHVAVLMGGDSYGFDVPGLGQGQSIYFQITRPSSQGPSCGENALVLVNPFNAVVESSYSNNAVTIAGYCNL